MSAEAQMPVQQAYLIKFRRSTQTIEETLVSPLADTAKGFIVLQQYSLGGARTAANALLADDCTIDSVECLENPSDQALIDALYRSPSIARFRERLKGGEIA